MVPWMYMRRERGDRRGARTARAPFNWLQVSNGGVLHFVDRSQVSWRGWDGYGYARCGSRGPFGVPRGPSRACRRCSRLIHHREAVVVEACGIKFRL
jgi:hypothetical protein